MEITVKGTAKEIADLVLQLQGRQTRSAELMANEVEKILTSRLTSQLASARIPEW